jgi:ribonuclease G
VNNELVIDVTASEIAIALLADKQLVEIQKEKSNLQFSVGDIHLGKVKKIMPGLNAAFVDVGYEKDAFLHYLDLGPQFSSLKKYLSVTFANKGKAPMLQRFKNEQDIDKNGKIADVLASGQLVLVQIAKEPISTKGPRLSSEISIAGRNLVLMPFSDKVSVSQKISSNEERNRLKTLVHSIKPKNYGVIVRTVAESKKVAELDAELKGLVKKWETAFEQLNPAQAPCLAISELNRASAILRDMLNGSFSSIWLNDEAIWQDIKGYIATIAPEKQDIVKLYSGNLPIFEHFGIEKQIKSLFGRTVSMKSGAYLIIEHTEALHVIDVNSGNRSKAAKDQESNALEVNLIAAAEIARQLRLRDMGGIIVIDFIDMQDNDHKLQVYEKMKEFMANDRAKHNILPLSKFGLMQITRQRVRPETNIAVIEKCPTCNGTGQIRASILLDDEIESSLKLLIEDKQVKNIYIRVHPFIASYLKKGFIPIYVKWMWKYKCRVHIIPISSYDYLEYHFFSNAKEEILT